MPGADAAPLLVHVPRHDPVLLVFAGRDRSLTRAVRLEGADVVTRIIDYHYASDTLRHLADAVGLDCAPRGYHQAPGILPGMAATTRLPWRTG